MPVTRRSSRRTTASTSAALAVVLATAVGLVGCSGDPGDDAIRPQVSGVVQPGAPGEPSRILDEAPDHRPAEHTPDDVAFARGMIAHHVQALRMTRLVPGRASREELRPFAERMDLSQEAELELLRDWLTARGEPVPPLSAAHDHADGDGDDGQVHGMLSERELRDLEAAEGARFDRLFLEGMIRHHEGALRMVHDLFAAGGGEEREIARFALHVQADQEVELVRMRQLLAELDGV